MAAFTPRERNGFLQHWRERVLANPRALTKTIVVDDSVAGYVGSIRVLERCGFRREGEAVTSDDGVEELSYRIDNSITADPVM